MIHIKKLVACLLVVVVLCLAGCLREITYETKYIANCETAEFHEDPSNNSDVLAILPKGEVLSYEKNVQNGYSKVVYNGTTGYVLSTYLSTEKPAEQAPTQQPQKTAEPKPVAVNTNNYNQKLAKKEYFLNKANGIERYENDYLDTAMSQHDMNIESGNVYKKWDALLNEVYQYLKTILPASEFKTLQQDEYRWVEQKERAIEEAGAEWAGGSGEPLARNSAGISETKDRCYYLISLID